MVSARPPARAGKVSGLAGTAGLAVAALATGHGGLLALALALILLLVLTIALLLVCGVILPVVWSRHPWRRRAASALVDQTMNRLSK